MAQAVMDRPTSTTNEKLERRITLGIVLVPFAAFLYAAIAMRSMTWTDLGIALAFYYFTGLGVTIGFHRHFTHQSFTARGPVRVVLAVAGSMAMQGSLIAWVADHRRHHAFSDREGDPHSPHLEDAKGVTGVLKGLWHAHTGWLFRPVEERTDRERWAPDLIKDPQVARIDRMFLPLSLLTIFAPGLAGLAITGTWRGALTAFLWAGLVRIFFLHHVTWSINSICHFYGRRPFESKDLSTNNWVLAIISFGESWHNNHHAFPTSAIHGLGRFQVDLTGFLIRTMEKLRLVTNVKVPSVETMKAKLRTAEPAPASAGI